MIALYIVGGILLLILWLLTRKIHVKVAFENQLYASFRYLFYTLDATGLVNKDAKKQPEVTQKAQKPKAQKPKPEFDLPPIKELIQILLDFVKKLFAKLGKAIVVKKSDVRVTVATDDPAKTALVYGAVSPVAAQLTQLIVKMRHSRRDDKRIKTLVEPDFLADKPIFFCDLYFTVRLWRLLPIAYEAYKLYKQLKENNHGKRNAPQANN